MVVREFGGVLVDQRLRQAFPSACHTAHRAPIWKLANEAFQDQRFPLELEDHLGTGCQVEAFPNRLRDGDLSLRRNRGFGHFLTSVRRPGPIIQSLAAFWGCFEETEGVV